MYPVFTGRFAPAAATPMLRYLHARSLDLASAAEMDGLEFRRWRLDDGDEPVGEAGLGPGRGGDRLLVRLPGPAGHRRAAAVALLTGMRVQEWPTLLLPELGLLDGSRPG